MLRIPGVSLFSNLILRFHGIGANVPVLPRRPPGGAPRGVVPRGPHWPDPGAAECGWHRAAASAKGRGPAAAEDHAQRVMFFWCFNLVMFGRLPADAWMLSQGMAALECGAEWMQAYAQCCAQGPLVRQFQLKTCRRCCIWGLSDCCLPMSLLWCCRCVCMCYHMLAG